jgi:hypothetical protein
MTSHTIDGVIDDVIDGVVTQFQDTDASCEALFREWKVANAGESTFETEVSRIMYMVI